MKPVVASLRSQGTRLIIYLDDILIIASSIETLNRHKTLAISLLESLGFLINYVLTPSQILCSWECWWIRIHIAPTEIGTDSKRMSPPLKHKQANYSPFVSGPRTSRGMSPSRMVCPTSLPSTTNSSDKRSSEMGELQRPGGFDTIGQIRPIMVGNDPTNPARESNCSANSRLNHLLGCFQTGGRESWGSQRTGGLWSEKESQDHINVLKLRAAFFALKSFLPTQTDKVICLKLDSTTAVSYLNNLGGTHRPQLLHLAIAI